jgi:hypothetical protein
MIGKSLGKFQPFKYIVFTEEVKEDDEEKNEVIQAMKQ